MQELITFIYRRRAFFTFVLLEVLALWLVFNQNSYQHYAYLSTSNWMNSKLYAAKDGTVNYFDLEQQNDSLWLANQQLLNQLKNRTEMRVVLEDSVLVKDSIFSVYEHIPAKVINNSIHLVNNYLTLNRGSKDGLKPGMGIITARGVVGKIKACSENYATAYSLLHSNMPISSALKGSGHLCTTKWNGQDPTKAELLNLAMHIPVEVGDTVITSGYNTVFPSNMMIGIVDGVEKDSKEIFQKVSITLATDFSKLGHLYVVRHKLAAEQDSLEQESFE